LSLDHYLDFLKVKPGALPGATALAQAKASGAFTATHQRYWDAARRTHLSPLILRQHDLRRPHLGAGPGERHQGLGSPPGTTTPGRFAWTKTADEILNSLADYLAKVGTGHRRDEQD
jgi:hypothetical protein